MSSKILFSVSAIVNLGLGLALIFAPEITLTQFGTEVRVPELIMARFLGAALATVGLVLWFAKDATDDQLQKNLSMGMLIGTVLALIVTIIGIGIIRSNGWLVIVIEVAFGLAYGFLIFLQPRMK